MAASQSHSRQILLQKQDKISNIWKTIIKIVHEICLIMTPTNFWATLKRFDAYAKPMDDFRIRTRSGGILTVLSGLVMIILFASEFRDYLQPQMKEELFVDTSRTGKDREAFRTLVESLVQMTTFISRIFLKLVELQKLTRLFCHNF